MLRPSGNPCNPPRPERAVRPAGTPRPVCLPSGNVPVRRRREKIAEGLSGIRTRPIHRTSARRVPTGETRRAPLFLAAIVTWCHNKRRAAFRRVIMTSCHNNARKEGKTPGNGEKTAAAPRRRWKSRRVFPKRRSPQNRKSPARFRENRSLNLPQSHRASVGFSPGRAGARAAPAPPDAGRQGGYYDTVSQ